MIIALLSVVLLSFAEQPALQGSRGAASPPRAKQGASRDPEERIKRVRITAELIDPSCLDQLRRICASTQHPGFECASLEPILVDYLAAIDKAEAEFRTAIAPLDAAAQDALEDELHAASAAYYARQASAAGTSPEDERAFSEAMGRVENSPYVLGVRQASEPCRVAQEEAVVTALTRLQAATQEVPALAEATAVVVLDLGGCSPDRDPNSRGSDYFPIVSPARLVARIMSDPGSPAAKCLAGTGLQERWQGRPSIWSGEGPFGQLVHEYLMVASARELERRSGVVRLIKSGLAASSPEEHQEVQEKINRYMQPVRETRIMTADDYMRRMLAAAQSEQERCPESALEDRIRETWLRVVCPDLGARQWLEGPGETAVLELAKDDPDLATSVMAAMADYRRDVAAARRDSIDAVMAVRRMVVQDDSSLSDALVRQHSAIAERLWSPQDRAIARLRGILQGERLAKFNALLAKAQADAEAYAQRPKNWIDKRVANDASR